MGREAGNGQWAVGKSVKAEISVGSTFAPLRNAHFPLRPRSAVLVPRHSSGCFLPKVDEVRRVLHSYFPGPMLAGFALALWKLLVDAASGSPPPLAATGPQGDRAGHSKGTPRERHESSVAVEPAPPSSSLASASTREINGGSFSEFQFRPRSPLGSASNTLLV